MTFPPPTHPKTPARGVWGYDKTQGIWLPMWVTPSGAVMICGLVGTQDLALFDYSSGVLASGATYTSSCFNTSQHGKITASVYAIRNMTFYIEQSRDCTHWDISSSFPVNASGTHGFQIDVLNPRGRVRLMTMVSGMSGFSASGSYRVSVYGRRI